MGETADIEPILSTLWNTYTYDELRRALQARSHQTGALLSHPAGLEEVESALLSEAVLRDPRAIYGPDDRQDIYEVEDPYIKGLAQSTVLVVLAHELVEQANGTFTLRTIPYRLRYNLCLGQRFADQPSADSAIGGSGFFITPSSLITAGHVVAGQPIANLRFVTGYQMRNRRTPITNFSRDQIFAGVRLIRSIFTQDDEDYALVQVACLGNGSGVPLVISPAPSVFPGDSLFVLGHPAGLPLKYGPNAAVRENKHRSFFVSNLDILAGNSGSPVFDVTNTVVGIQVRGFPDFIETPQGCNIVTTCPDTGCSGEHAQRITGVIGPVRDLSMALEIGDNGLWSSRKVKVRLKHGGKQVTLPIVKFDPGRSYPYQLNPSEMGIDRIDAIDMVEIVSPPELNPTFSDEWTLAGVKLLVNGGQVLHDIRTNHTFPDLDSPRNTWYHAIPILEEPSTLGNVQFGFGSTPVGNTNWQPYGDGIYLDVDTSAIGFTATPLYFPSLGGETQHWQVKGVTSIYSPTPKGFRVYILRTDNDMTPQQANQLKWHINWFGYLRIGKQRSPMNMYGGSTPAGNTNWQEYQGIGISVDVDATDAGFSTTPLYFTSLGGDEKHWLVEGVTSIYSPTAQGFRVYILWQDRQPITPEQANQMKWHINWVGIQVWN